MTSTSFTDLDLCEPLLAALEAEGYTTPTPIQAAAIPHVLAGRDLLGCAQTGTGKTAAFALPLLQKLEQERRAAAPNSPRILVLSPTRELAAQISDSFATYGRNVKFRQTAIYGGVGQTPQERALARGVHVVVATPGRFVDLMQQGCVRLDRLEVFVLDEADRMLDMGFLPALRTIIARLPAQRQSLFFSATMPHGIRELAEGLLTDPVRVAVTPPASTVELIDQRVIFVDRRQKSSLLSHVLRQPDARRVLVFARTKRGANDLAGRLRDTGVEADAIHGNKSQSARERALDGFRTGRVRVLVATDLAARGIDVDGVTHVINFDLPVEPESYVHRIGRTGRAGAAGIALSFCDSGERACLRAIEKLIRKPLTVDEGHPMPRATSAEGQPKASSPRGPHPQKERPLGNRPFRGGRRPARPSGRRRRPANA